MVHSKKLSFKGYLLFSVDFNLSYQNYGWSVAQLLMIALNNPENFDSYSWEMVKISDVWSFLKALWKFPVSWSFTLLQATTQEKFYTLACNLQ